VLALDADTAGEEAMLRCVDYENSLDIELKVVVLPEGEDPDSVIREDTGKWNDLLVKALPVMDYIFSVIGASLDLTRASDKREAVERIGPHVAPIPNLVRRTHYIQKLARLVGTDERTVEVTLGVKKVTPVSGKSRRVKPSLPPRSPEIILSRPIEEQFLALLLKHPEFKEKSAGVPAEYFENSENREIFIAWQESTDEEALKEKLDEILSDYLDTLSSKNILATKVNERYNEYVLRLKEDHLRSLARKGETVKTAGEFPGEKDIELTDNLREIFNIRARREGGKGDRK
jgi:DNA primase